LDHEPFVGTQGGGEFSVGAAEVHGKAALNSGGFQDLTSLPQDGIRAVWIGFLRFVNHRPGRRCSHQRCKDGLS
jgi:hypothetical protein